jgi:hypothetical protein
MSPRALLLTLAAPLLLTACARGPSDEEINQAIQARTAGLLGGLIKAARKVGCEKSGEAWLCDVAVTMTMAGQELTNVQRLRFIKTDKGWAVSQ